ncbi:MAG: hypothetical protein HRT97_08275 [Moritella sp.]|uniref:hypothetical protein n=1 Tax=Moritella sp. TaxID=78556 RepID=UPI0025DFFC92|nr:hypothetical protein [Moritella sp.]NQZ92321.1 hypothetical protein [Moritella sp.]
MNRQNLAKTLSDIDAPETWGQHSRSIDPKIKAEVFNIAEMLWTERMARTGNLLLHPDILDQLIKQNWKPTDVQKRMIWASVLALASGPKSKERFDLIKKRLLKKHGRDWWEDVYQRKTNAWAAKERIKKQRVENGSAINILADNTHLFAGAVAEQKLDALRMIPKV